MSHRSSSSKPSDPGSQEEDSGSGPPENGPPLSAADTAAYIGSLAGELAVLARSARLNGLAHLLEMARFEAAEVMRGGAKRI